MSFRASFLLASIAVVGLGAIDPHRVCAQPVAKAGKLTVKTYAVADLVVANNDQRTGPKSREEAADRLIKTITAKIAKDSWSDFGGSASIRYFPNGMILVIRQTEAAQIEIGKLLAEMRRPDSRDEERLVRVVFPIADLIAPIDDHSVMNDATPRKTPATRSKDELGNNLAAIIRDTIAAESWNKERGVSIEYTPFGQELVVNNVQTVQKQVETLLAELRQVQGMQISFELRMFEVTPALADPILKALAKDREKVRVGAKTDRMTITEIQNFMLMEFLTGERNAVMNQAPKLTVYNGQKAGVDIRRNQVGLRYDVQPIASEDRTSVRVALEFEYTLPEKVKGKARRVRMAETFNVPDNRTVVWHIGDVGGTHLFMTATPRIIMVEEEEQIFLGKLPPIPRD